MAGKEAGETAFRNALETADRRLKTAETLCGELSVKTAGESESKLAGKEEELAGVKRELAGVREELAGKEAELAGMREKLAGNETELAGSETMVSLDDSFWRERAETAEAQNSVYLGQLEELKEKLREFVDGGNSLSDLAGEMAGDVESLRRQLRHSRGETALWRQAAAEASAVATSLVANASSTSDEQLMALEVVAEGLLNEAVERLVLDFGIDVCVEGVEEEYAKRVREEEGREPMVVEVKMVTVQRIVEMAADWFTQVKYQLEMEVAAEREKDRKEL